MEKQRQELTNAEKLFDLTITMYPAMLDIDKELKNVTKVFGIYEAQKVRYSIPILPSSFSYYYLQNHISLVSILLSSFLYLGCT